MTDLQTKMIVDSSRSSHARLRPLSLSSVKLTDRFWAPRLRALQEVTLPTQYDLMEETGRLDNFRRAAGKVGGDFRGRYYNDSDVYKWVEACALSLMTNHDACVAELMNRVISEIAAAQCDDGYLNTYFSHEHAGERWTNLRDKHELYLAGHLFQAAVAHHRAPLTPGPSPACGTSAAAVGFAGGRGVRGEGLLAVATRFADYIASVFGPGKRPESDGHPEIEMALVELYRETGERRYFDLAQFFLDMRGHGHLGGSAVHVDHQPFREMNEIVGHVVRSVYLNCGAADLYAETGERALLETLQRLWRNLTDRRLYVTGGAGARHEGEAFGRDYELPNERAYAETCAAIAIVMWAWRMLLISAGSPGTGEPTYADVLERALYNGALAGIGLDGQSYFYVNPLADRGSHRRQPYFDCACCPPNIARLLAMVPGFVYSTSDDGVWVHLYVNSVATMSVGGADVGITQYTNYPWDGEVELVLVLTQPTTFTLRLRVPAWCEGAKVGVNYELLGEAPGGDYFAITREWQTSDVVHLSMPMTAQFISSHPNVEANRGCVAIQRGPLVYCVEQADNPDFDVWELAVSSHSYLSDEFAPELLDGMVIISGECTALRRNDKRLYQRASSVSAMSTRLTAIPYFAWANREAGAMQVWLPRG